MNQETNLFISEHKEDDIHHLSLQSSRYPLVDMPLAIRQINGLQKVKLKIPLFFNSPDILFPVQLSLEQSSSESTAKYKSTLCEGNLLIDLTGGFGVDCCFMAVNFKKTVYVEQNQELCHLAVHNFNVLNRLQIEVRNVNAETFLSEFNQKADWIYIDPARRSSTGKKVVFLSDCEPNVAELAPVLLTKATKVMLKLSPMMDISAAVNELKHTAEIHIISIENECKEVLLILDNEVNKSPKIKTINLAKANKTELFEYKHDEEMSAEVNFATSLSGYLYEPNSAILKSGAFRLISERFGLDKLHINSHLYCSSNLIPDFPGRIFRMEKVWGNSKNELRELAQKIPKANISTRNYPISADELRKKLKIKDGGDIYLFASTAANENKLIIECRKV